MLKPEDISAIFEWIELLLIGSLKRNLASHKQEEEKEGFNWTSWQAEKLRNVDSFHRQTRSIMSQYTDIIDSETRQLLEEQFNENAVFPENNNETTVGDGVPQEQSIETTPEPHFFGVDRTKNEKLIEDVTNIEKQAETAALRMTDDVYRQTVNRVQLAMATGSMSYEKAVDTAVADFLAQGINCIEYRDGRRVNIADYVRMVLRTTSARAALQGKSERYKAQGYDTVLVSSYGMCSKTCLPWQGKPYINDAFTDWDGETKTVSGIRYGKSHYCDKWFPLLSSAIEKGLFHPNCRHSINLYIEGVTDLPEPMDNSDIERRYKLEQRQRALEREVRKAKRKVEGFTDAENIKKAKAELREAQKNVREYIAKVNAEEGARVLARNPLQEKIYSGDVRIGSSAEPVHAPESLPANVSDGHSVEVDIPAPDNGQPEYTDTPIPKNVHNSSVDNSVKSGIIELGSEAMYRKPKPDKIEPMSRKQFRTIVKAFKRNGGLIQFDDETEEYLDSKNAEAITYNENTILIRQSPGRASVFEELIHTEQYRNGRNDGSYKSRLQCEIEAQKKLIKNSKAYKLTEREVFQTQKALEAYENELREYYKNGGV